MFLLLLFLPCACRPLHFLLLLRYTGRTLHRYHARKILFSSSLSSFWYVAVITPTTTTLETTTSRITSPSMTKRKSVGTVNDLTLPIATKQPTDATTSIKITTHEAEATSHGEKNTPPTMVNESTNVEDTAVGSMTTVSGIAEETAADVSEEPIDGAITTPFETEDVSLENKHTLSTTEAAAAHGGETVDDSMTTDSDTVKATAAMLTDGSMEATTSSDDEYTDDSAIGNKESEPAKATSTIDDSMTTVSDIEEENATSVSNERASSAAVTASTPERLNTTVSHSPTTTARHSDVTSSVSVGISPANEHGGTSMTPDTSGHSTASRATTTERVMRKTRLTTLQAHGVVSTATTAEAGDTTSRITVTRKTPHTSSLSDETTTGSQTSTGSVATHKQTATSKSPSSTERMTEDIANHSSSTTVIPKTTSTESEATVPTASSTRAPVTVKSSSSPSASVTPTTTTTTPTTTTTLPPPPTTTATTVVVPTSTNGTVVVGASTSDSDGPSDAVVAIIIVIICLLVLVLVGLLAVYYVRKQRYVLSLTFTHFTLFELFCCRRRVDIQLDVCPSPSCSLLSLGFQSLCTVLTYRYPSDFDAFCHCITSALLWWDDGAIRLTCDPHLIIFLLPTENTSIKTVYLGVWRGSIRKACFTGTVFFYMYCQNHSEQPNRQWSSL